MAAVLKSAGIIKIHVCKRYAPCWGYHALRHKKLCTVRRRYAYMVVRSLSEKCYCTDRNTVCRIYARCSAPRDAIYISHAVFNSGKIKVTVKIRCPKKLMPERGVC